MRHIRSMLPVIVVMLGSGVTGGGTTAQEASPVASPEGTLDLAAMALAA